MLPLVLSAICSALLFVIFRLFAVFGVKILPAIVVNYLVCTTMGLAFAWPYAASAEALPSLAGWLPYSLFLGGLFIGGFYLTAVSTQRAGVAVTTLASKLSLVIPVAISIWILRTGVFTSISSMAGMALALPCIVLSVLPSGKKFQLAEGLYRHRYGWILPVAVFVVGGLIDTLINAANTQVYLPLEQALLPASIFGVAALIGLLVIWQVGVSLSRRNIIGGICLGVPNYFSIYWLLEALAHFDNNGAMLFPLYNILIILLASAVSVLGFKERLGRANIAGLVLSVLALALMAWQ